MNAKRDGTGACAGCNRTLDTAPQRGHISRFGQQKATNQFAVNGAFNQQTTEEVMTRWIDREDPVVQNAMDKDHSVNHAAEITTEGILEGMEKLEQIPGIAEFNTMIKEMMENGDGEQK
ncbi:MAG: hypothetical protein LBI62_07410 [Candidatus Accumulibacter sp.]|jgi:hypothetical protein|nr:hypothetical protein [Accumulibacter sp.]